MRCLKFGCMCDGYEDKFASNAVFRHSTSITMPEFKPIFYQPATELFKDEQEYRYFQQFCNKTALQLSGCFDSELWSRLILQACHNDQSIRHAAIAIAALNMTLDCSWQKSHNKRNVDPDIHHQFAICQYSKAISHMRKAAAAGSQDLRTTLISCIVITCFESFHGDQVSAIAQVRTGLSLVEGYFASLTCSTRFTPISVIPDIIEDELIQAFGRLDVQHMSFSDSRPAAIHQEMQYYGQPLINSMPKTFDSLKQARMYLALLMQRFLHFKTFIMGGTAYQGSLHSDDTKHIKDELAASRENHITDLVNWQSAFRPLFTQSRTPSGHKNFLEATALRLHYIATYFSAASVPTELDNCASIPLHRDVNNLPTSSPLNIRTFMPLLKEIVSLSRIIISHPTMSLSQGKCPFTFDLHVIVPLYMVGKYCPHSVVRREALQLLLESPRREGLWDGVLAGKMVEFIVSLEEETGLDGDFVKREAKMRGTDVKLRYPGRSAVLQCFMPDLGTDRVVLREKLITW